MKRIFAKSMVAFVLFSASIHAFAATVTKTIYGLDSAQDFQSESNGKFYVQIGSFKSKSNAEKIVETIRSKTNTPVVMTEKKGIYVVTLGPFDSAADVRSISEALAASLPRLPTYPPFRKPKPLAPDAVVKPQDATDLTEEQDNWYIEGILGAETPLVNNTLTANNGFGFILPPPYDMDSLTTKTRWGAVLGLGAGYRWQPNTRWLPAYSVGVRYKHYYPTNIGNQVSQFSLAEFTNNYNWNVAADLVMIAGKLNISRVGNFLPFINAGAGLAFNRTSNYYEVPAPDGSLRTNPGFRNDHTCRFTYSFGAGVDWQVHPKLIVSLDYEFQDLGSLYSGNGVENFSASSLYSKIYQSNNILLSMSYLIGK